MPTTGIVVNAADSSPERSRLGGKGRSQSRVGIFRETGHPSVLGVSLLWGLGCLCLQVSLVSSLPAALNNEPDAYNIVHNLLYAVRRRRVTLESM